MMATSYQKSTFDETQLIALADKLMPVLERLPTGMTLIAENLFDHTEWQEMTGHQKRKTGEMIAILVSHKILQVDFLQTAGSTKRYIKN